MNLDFSFLASLVTVLALGAFVAIVGWTLSPRQKSRFDAASQLPFALPDEPAFTGPDAGKTEHGQPGARA